MNVYVCVWFISGHSRAFFLPLPLPPLTITWMSFYIALLVHI